MTDTSVHKPGFYGWKNVALLFVSYLSTLGLAFYGFSVIFPMMIKTLEWNRATASIAHTLNVLLSGLLVPLVALSINKIGIRKTLMTGAGILFVGLLLLGTITSKIWQWIILWGFFVSFGFAFCGGVPIQTLLMHWFSARRATVIGIVMTGAPVGGVLALPFYTWLMQKTQMWQAGWLTGAFFALISMGCFFFLTNKPQDVGQHPDGLNPDDLKFAIDAMGKTTRTFRSESSWELKTALKTPTLWFLAVEIIAFMMALYLITSHGVLHFMDKGFSGMQAASILSFVILGSGLARFPAGWLGDRIEPRWIISTTMGVMLVMLLGLWKLTEFRIVAAAGMVFGFCYGSQLIMFPTLMGNYYGPEAFPAINGVLGPIMIVFAALVPVGAGMIFEKTGTYDLAFIILGFVLVVAFAISFLLSPPQKN
jgi:MFS family permease